MHIPIVIFIYKRPNLTEKLWEVIKCVQPSTIYIFADGPKNDTEIHLCQHARKITEQPNWPVNIYRHYEEYNQGLSANILKGLNTVFTHHNFAIILEDDCLPEMTFFNFCEAINELYKNDKQVMQISGTNFIAANTIEDDELYFFSRFTLPCWGWATWKHAWIKFNHHYTTWQLNQSLISQTVSPQNLHTWSKVFHSLSNGNRDSWDVQWMLDVWLNNGFTVIPKTNLVKNIGEGEGASYMAKNSHFANINTKPIDVTGLKKLLITPTNNELIIEEQVVLMLQEFITYNTPKNVFKRSMQAINKIAPKQLKHTYKSLAELKSDILPLPKYTLLPLSFFYAFIKLVQSNKVILTGNWLQFGAWLGGSTLFMRACMHDIGNKNELFVYDTFGGIPTHQLTNEKDKKFVEYFNITSDIKNYKTSVVNLLQDEQLLVNTTLIEKDISTINHYEIPDKVSLICIDVDFYEPTLKALSLAYQKLAVNGVIIIDDYYLDLLCCKEAVDLFFKEMLANNEVAFERFNEFTLLVTKLN